MLFELIVMCEWFIHKSNITNIRKCFSDKESFSVKSIHFIAVNNSTVFGKSKVRESRSFFLLRSI